MYIELKSYLDTGRALDIVDAHHEEVPKLKLGLLRHHLLLHAPVRVVDNGQEHVEQDEEDEEDVAHEVERPEGAVRVLNRAQVEVAEHGAEHGVAGLDDGLVGVQLAAEEQVAEVGEGEEDDEKHDAEA